ncbi:DEAD/DEAH box helicase [Micrococcales bacterium 31B]|nr:DEAD/DEAH box helicase [Micrococcales bacterium 31B]
MRRLRPFRSGQPPRVRPLTHVTSFFPCAARAPRWQRDRPLSSKGHFVPQDSTVDSAHEATPTVADSEATPEVVDVTPEEAAQQSFGDFGLHEDIVQALAAKGITHPFPIQSMTLPVALSRHDIIGQAKTGTGKTLGFGLPMLQNVLAPNDEGFDALAVPGAPQGLVVVPTRELAIQVGKDLADAGTLRGIRVTTIYGGRAFEPQVEALKKGVEVVVGTPGRLIDLQRQGLLNLKYVTTVVLDEADEMLDLGFLEDVEKILKNVAATRHTMLFSATMPGPVVALARRFMSRPTHIRAHDPEDQGITKADIKQVVYRAHALDKIEVLARILQSNGRGLTVVFARTKRTADRTARDLQDRGFAAAPLHGDMGQGAREQALRAFRNGKVDVLVATDVAARGIDIDDVTHVVNHECPEDEKVYLHRTGRTGRAGNKGTAVTFVDWEDMTRWSVINKALGLDINVPLETYSTSEHLFIDLDIPQGVKGTLPRAQRTREGLDAEELEDLGETGQRRGKGRDSRDGRGGRGDRGGRGGRQGGPSSGGRGSRREEGRGEGRGGARGGDAGPEQSTDAGERQPRQKRERRRTRGARGAGGQPAGQAPTGSGGSGASGGSISGSVVTTPPVVSASVEKTSNSLGGEVTAAPRRRRRTRRPAGEGSAE